MIRYLLCFHCIFISWQSFAQMDIQEIKNKTTDTSSEFYYKKIWTRFKNSDSNLTKDHFYYFYYASPFLPSYQIEAIDSIEQTIREANFAKDFIRAYELADSLLQHYPTSIQAYFEKAFACYNLKRFEEEEYNKKRYKVLLKTIMDSGDGKSISSPWYVNLPNDEFEVIRYLGAEIKDESELEVKDQVYDYFTLKPNKSKRKELFFNVTAQIE